MLAAESLKVFLQERPHPNDAISHLLDFTEPLLIQCRIIEDLRGDSCAVYWWIRVEGADQNFDLGIDTLPFLR